FMDTGLFDGREGYYMASTPLGRDGDFITSPEISQIFGELVAIWIIHLWNESGRPSPFCLAEIGPGRGTLMADILRIITRLQPELLQAARIRMIETSPALAAAQKACLAKCGNHGIEWVEQLAQLPEGLPLVLIGNELFDAIPVRQYIKTPQGWRERMVGLDAKDRLCFLAGPGSIDQDLLPPEADLQPTGSIFEISPAREALAEDIAARIAADGVAALMFDYGHVSSGFGDTFQAVRNHAYEPVLASPGRADLTSHVDFAALAEAVLRGNARSATRTQGEFLLEMGILERTGRLTANQDAARAASIRGSVKRLIDPDQMGSLFKAFAIFPEGTPPYPFLQGME